MKINICPYQLKKKSKLNSQNLSDIQNGALVKIIEGDFWGVADVCPKPELGDVELELELKTEGNLFKRALELAEQDLKARKEKRSLLQNKFVNNNILILDYKTVDLNSQKYTDQTIKIKGDHDIENLAVKLNQTENLVKVRIDFNSCLSDEKFDSFLKLLTTDSLKKIEYIEDPTVFNSEWKEWNKKISLAFDFQKTDYDREFAKFQIIKPSRQRIPENTENVILTSAMEHPVGLAHALSLAQPYSEKILGFGTLKLFEDSGFHQFFIEDENKINFSDQILKDFGIGMTEALNKLNWQNL